VEKLFWTCLTNPIFFHGICGLAAGREHFFADRRGSYFTTGGPGAPRWNFPACNRAVRPAVGSTIFELGGPMVFPLTGGVNRSTHHRAVENSILEDSIHVPDAIRACGMGFDWGGTYRASHRVEGMLGERERFFRVHEQNTGGMTFRFQRRSC